MADSEDIQLVETPAVPAEESSAPPLPDSSSSQIKLDAQDVDTPQVDEALVKPEPSEQKAINPEKLPSAERRATERAVGGFTWDAVFVFAVGEEGNKVTVKHVEQPAVEAQVLDEKVASSDDLTAAPVTRERRATVYTKKKVPEQEHFRNTTAEVVEKLEEAGLVTDMWYSTQKDEVYVRVGVSEKRLMEEADRIDFDLKLDEKECVRQGASGENIGQPVQLAVRTIKAAKKHKSVWSHIPVPEFMNNATPMGEDLWDNIYGKYDKVNADGADKWRQALYKRYPDEERISQLRDKAEITQLDDIETKELAYLEEEFERQPNSLFNVTARLKLLVSIIEADAKLDGADLSIGRAISSDKHSMIAFFPLHQKKRKKYLEAKWLRMESVFSPPLDDIQSYFGEKIAFYFAFLAFYNRNLVVPSIIGTIFLVWQIWENRVDVEGVPFYAIFVSLWATLFLEAWKRKEAWYRVKWGMTKYQSKEQPRPEFHGSWEPSPVDGRDVEVFAWKERVLRAMASQMVIWTLIIMVVGAVVGIFVFRTIAEEWNSVWGVYLTAILNAIQIQIWNIFYGWVAEKLNEYENHRTDSEFENALIAKSFLFKFVNSYNTLFYIIFLKIHVEDECAPGGCLAELNKQLMTIFISLIVINNALELGIPYLKKRKAAKDNLADPEAEKFKSQPEKEFEKEPYLSTFDDFDELIIQFGYISLFVVAFPLAPLLALLNNVLETRIDATKLCKLTRRPEPAGAYDIGTWSAILNIVSFIAVMTNVGIVCFRTELVESWVDEQEEKYELFIGAEHILFLIKFSIAYFVPDESEELVQHRDRQDYIVDVLINGVEEEPYVPLEERMDTDPEARTIDFDWDARCADHMRPSRVAW